MSNCRHCQEPIVKVEGQKMRRFYCSFTCYQRFTTRIKYWKNHEKQLEKAKRRAKDPKQLQRVKEFDTQYKEWIYEQGLTLKNLKDFGIVFLRENPEVVETLRVMNSINSTKMTQEQKKDYKRQYYIKNRDKFLQRQKEYRNKLKNK